MVDHVRNEAGQRMAIGQRVILDDKVPGVVDGFYLTAGGELTVVFRSDLKVRKTMYGLMPLTPDRENPGNENLKILSFSLILCHPSNLKPEAA